MSEVNHTPGPWHVVGDAVHPSNARITSTAKRHIAKVYAGEMGVDETCIANARLIAAAPALLDGAEYADGCYEAALAEGWLNALADGDIERIRDIWNRRLSVARERLIPAISAAEGRDHGKGEG